MKGVEIIDIIEAWLNQKNVHPDDFNMMFAKELLDIMAKDK